MGCGAVYPLGIWEAVLLFVIIIVFKSSSFKANALLLLGSVSGRKRDIFILEQSLVVEQAMGGTLWLPCGTSGIVRPCASRLSALTAHCLDDMGLLLVHMAWHPDFCLCSHFLAQSSRRGCWVKWGDWGLVYPMQHRFWSATTVCDSLEVG